MSDRKKTLCSIMDHFGWKGVAACHASEQHPNTGRFMNPDKLCILMATFQREVDISYVHIHKKLSPSPPAAITMI